MKNQSECLKNYSWDKFLAVWSADTGNVQSQCQAVDNVNDEPEVFCSSCKALSEMRQGIWQGICQ